jgi:hypothetical protein
MKTYFFITVLIILFNTSAAFSQNKLNGNFGLRCSGNISANRFGPIISPSLFYKTKRSNYTFGLMLQGKHHKMDGIQTNYEFTLVDSETDNDCNVQWLGLYAFLNIGYHNKAFLNQTACEEENCSNRELTFEPAKIEMKAIEAYAGFGLRVTLFKNLKWFNAIGIGGYNVFNPTKELYYNNRSIGLLLRTGIAYQFSKTMKGNF